MQDARDLINETVLVKLRDNTGLGFLGVPEDGPFFCKVVAVDEIGVWVENKRFETIELTDSSGRPVPEKKRKPERHVVNILFPWKDIHTIVRFAENDAEKMVKELMEGADEEDRRIGFLR